MEKDAYLSELIRYIHLNPVRANMVSDPIDYPLSSHAAYAGRVKSPCWLSVDQGLGHFGKTKSSAQAAYLHFMGQITEEELLEQLRHGTKQGRILGNEDFIKGALKQNKEKVSTEITIEQIVTPYSRNIARSVLKTPKLYFYDTGLVKGDEGAIYENMVALCLLKHVYAQVDLEGKSASLHYIRTKDGAEVDFCLTQDNTPEVLIIRLRLLWLLEIN